MFEAVLPEMLALVRAIPGRVVDMGLVGVIMVVFTLALRRIPTSDGRTNFVVQHGPWTVDQLREVGWALLGPLVLAPLVAVQSRMLVDGLLGPYVPHYPLAGFVSGLPFGLQVLFGALVVDFVTYWRHRFVHVFAWPYHTIHHAAREIHWTTTVRLHPGDVFLMSLVRIPLMYVLGFDGPAMVAAEAIHHYANVTNHLNLSLDWPGPLRYLLVSPNMHRWHHAADDPRAIDKNFAVVFAIWDVMFGTFYVPRNRLPGAYGVWDERGDDVVSPRFADQLAYPFVHHAAAIRRWITARTSSTT